MSSHSTDAKLDAMDTLSFAVDQFDAMTLKCFFPEIWAAIRHEVSLQKPCIMRWISLSGFSTS